MVECCDVAGPDTERRVDSGSVVYAIASMSNSFSVLSMLMPISTGVSCSI